MVKISVVMPVFNEAKYIEECVQSLLTSELDEGITLSELLIYDGGSDDGTVEKLDILRRKHPAIALKRNVKKKQVYALNMALEEYHGDVLIRCDAHARYTIDYLNTLVTFLNERRDIGNVGLPYNTITEKQGFMGLVYSFLMSHPVGVGTSHRSRKKRGRLIDVDTLLFGAWRRDTLDEIGSFDESFVRGQDYEHNYRIKKSGLKVCLVPGTPFVYYTRNSLSKLLRMVFQYASAKGNMLRKYKEIPNIRSFVPFSVWICLLFLVLLNVTMFKYALVGYFLVLLFLVFSISSRSNEGRIFVKLSAIPIALLMHLAHALGVGYGILVHAILKREKMDLNETR